MESNPPSIKPVRTYKCMLKLMIPSIPPPGSYSGSASAPTTPITPVTPASTTSTSSQVRLRAPMRSKWQKIEDVLTTYGFDSLGEFLETLFHIHERGDHDPRKPTHIGTVTSFLNGSSTIAMAAILMLIYRHPQSRPKTKYPDQVEAAFSPHKPLEEIRFARPCLNAWATRVVGDEIYRRIGKLARKDDDPNSRTHIRATTNGRKKDARVMTWEDTEFTIQGLADQYREADTFVWYLTECFCAPRVKGEVVVRKRRPHPAIQVAALSSFILSRNSYASGDLALPLGIWQFACQSHVDVKRVYCRLGSVVSDSTTRKALNSMSAADMENLREKVRLATEKGESAVGKVLDNIQHYEVVHEPGLGREPQLKCGTACTAFEYDDVQPGAFDASDHIARIVRQERQTMTTESVFESIDWSHIGDVTELHFVRVLAEFTPHLIHLIKQISARFRGPLAKHRIPVRKKRLQPLATNAEREVTYQGMKSCFADHDKQMGIEPEKCDNILSWTRGDGASHGTIKGLQKFLAVSRKISTSLRNTLSTPEFWHTKGTDVNSCASNHYGPASSKDPSSLSRSSNAANMKRPTDLKKCDFYPTTRSMTLIWEAQVLDCWRHVLGIDSDIHAHFEKLAKNNALPSLDDLLVKARILRARYASQTAYNQSLSKSEYDNALPHTQVPTGSVWTSPAAPDDAASTDAAPASEHDPEPDMPGLVDISDDSAGPLDSVDAPPLESHAQNIPSATAAKDEPHVHVEDDDFDGDRVLSNSILFIMEYGWWTELNYAIPEGDIGRVLEILKIFIFTFAGTANQNYMRYMLDVYALLEFECSPALKITLLNNWLFNLRGEAGKFVEGDVTQEWFNKWLIGMVKRRGGEFDDKYYRQTIAPNVFHFLKIKEDIESAFDLKRRSKAHTSPHLRDETQILLRMYKEEELHLFRPGRSMGHAAVNRFDRGYQRLEDGKMREYLERSAEPSHRTAAIAPNPSAPELILFTPSNPRITASGLRQLNPVIQYHLFQQFHQLLLLQPIHCVADEPLASGSDLAVTIDEETGLMSADWYSEEEFEDILVRLCGEEEELETSDEEDEPESEDDVASDSDDEKENNID
ncbi:hypothetical protein MVEN_00026800 [Mycena venus]|uniref:DUF6589 domain-containing protein n=1 Tax=Mycena venus TaxID=2733690 RepID=A0A8H6Z6X1_9AGAR|nr:hypothetical protein MVEN_00026800 [Mycena venus]